MAIGVAEHSHGEPSHLCIGQGDHVAASMHVALLQSIKDTLTTHIPKGACPRAKAHLAEISGMTSYHWHTGFHSNSQVIGMLLHLIVQLATFPKPSCTMEKTAQTSVASVSRGTQSESPSFSSMVSCGTEMPKELMKDEESQAVAATISEHVQTQVATNELGVQAVSRARSIGQQTVVDDTMRNDMESQAVVQCECCRTNPVLMEGSVCSHCCFKVQRQQPMCETCNQKPQLAGERVCSDCQVAAVQSRDLSFARPSTCLCSNCHSAHVQRAGNICIDCGCPRCRVNVKLLGENECAKCRPVPQEFLCSRCHTTPVQGSGMMCQGCCCSRCLVNPALQGESCCIDCSSPSRGVRIGGGYDLLAVTSHDLCAKETVRADSPYRTERPFRHGAPSQASSPDRYAVGSYTRSSPLGVPVCPGSGAVGTLAIEPALNGVDTAYQLYRVMTPATRSSSRSLSTSRSGKRSSSNPPAVDSSVSRQQQSVDNVSVRSGIEADTQDVAFGQDIGSARRGRPMRSSPQPPQQQRIGTHWNPPNRRNIDIQSHMP